MTQRSMILVTASLATLLALFAPAPLARADIFRWQYGDYTQGKQPSAMLAPDGAGANAVPGANLSNRNLTMAYLCGAYLPGANFTQANLTQAALGGTGGSYSSIPGATLTNANFSQANLTQADFSGYTGIDLEGYSYYYLGADLTGANLFQANLTGANFFAATLTNANLNQLNLANAGFSGATLTGANLTGAEVRGANFSLAYVGHPHGYLGGITLAQLYSTASYQAHDLTGIGLRDNNLADVNLAGQNLTNAYLEGTNLIGANLTGAEVRGANFSGYSTLALPQLYSTASYQAHDLTGIGLAGNDLTGGNFIGQNLTNADFTNAALTNSDLSQANLTGAAVRGANFGKALNLGTGITLAQLYSTASYQAHDLIGIGLGGNNLMGANLASQNLTNANFSGATLIGANLTNADFSAGIDSYYPYIFFGSADMTGANLSQANLANANFAGMIACDEYGCGIIPGASFFGANLSGADARGANFQYATLSGANTSNLIQSNGHIAGLDLTAGASLVVRDYDGNPAASPPTGPLPIVVDQHVAMDATGTLRLEFDADPWDSTISFAPGIPVTRGGALELTFASDVNLASQVGRTIDLFDWTGVNPTGTFTISSPYTWNLSKLYTTGEVTLTALAAIPGDFNNNGVVDAADYVVWRKTDGTPAGYNAWRTHFGQPGGSGSVVSANAAVPEPTTLVMLVVAVSGVLTRRRWRK